jgi:hypothetical protein
MCYRQMVSLAAVAILGIMCVSAEAFAARGAARGGAVAHRGAVGVRGGAIAHRGAVGVGGGIAYRGPGYGGGVYRGGYYRPGVGIAAGAVVGGAIAASQYGGYGYDNNYYYGSNPGYSASYSTSGGQDAAYCAQRFKSYDASSVTYLGYGGQRHPCPLGPMGLEASGASSIEHNSASWLGVSPCPLRREGYGFSPLVCGMAAAPLAARAQKPEKRRRSRSGRVWRLCR